MEQGIQLLFNYGVPCGILLVIFSFFYKYLPKWAENWMAHQKEKDEFIQKNIADSLVAIQKSNENITRIASLAVEEIKSTHQDIDGMGKDIAIIKTDVSDIKNRIDTIK